MNNKRLTINDNYAAELQAVGCWLLAVNGYGL